MILLRFYDTQHTGVDLALLVPRYWTPNFFLGKAVVLLVIVMALGAQVSCIRTTKRGARKGAEMEFLVPALCVPSFLLGQHQ
jgi:hypothetical protein